MYVCMSVFVSVFEGVCEGLCVDMGECESMCLCK